MKCNWNQYAETQSIQNKRKKYRLRWKDLTLLPFLLLLKITLKFKINAEHWRKETRENKALGEKLVLMLLCPPKVQI